MRSGLSEAYFLTGKNPCFFRSDMSFSFFRKVVDTIFLILKKFHYFFAEKVVKLFLKLNFVSFSRGILSDLLQKQQEK